MFLDARIRFSMANCCVPVTSFEFLEHVEQTEQGCIHKLEIAMFYSIP